MDAATALKRARRRGGLSQRDLARASGLAQPAIARIESGVVSPRVDTIDRLLQACGESLVTEPRLGVGIDRSAMRALLRLSPGDRARLAAAEADNLDRALAGIRPERRG
jgi:transcriptional regulator with XRE-family HTH domain